MSDQQTLIDIDGPATADVVAAAVLAAQMTIIDAAVRQARQNNWCGEFERIMGTLFPAGPPDGSMEYVDSDGWSCRDRDRDGYDRDGYDRDGYDRDGYLSDGYNRHGYNRDGYNRRGWNREGLNRDGRDRNDPVVRMTYRYDYAGYDADGYRRGVSREGYSRDEQEARGGVYRYDENGWDIDGLNRYGEHY